MYKLLIIIALVVVTKRLSSPTRKRKKPRKSARAKVREGKEVEPGDLLQTLSALLKSVATPETPAKPQGRKRAKQMPPVPPVVDEGRKASMTPVSTDTTMRMRDYHSTLRPSDYILRRGQDEMEHLSRSVVSEPEESLGSRLFDTEDRSRTLREAILRAEILRRRGA